MRLWHAAGIRPVSSRPHVRLPWRPDGLRPLIGFHLRHHSSNATGTPAAGAHDDAAVERAVQKILAALKKADDTTPLVDLYNKSSTKAKDSTQVKESIPGKEPRAGKDLIDGENSAQGKNSIEAKDSPNRKQLKGKGKSKSSLKSKALEKAKDSKKAKAVRDNNNASKRAKTAEKAKDVVNATPSEESSTVTLDIKESSTVTSDTPDTNSSTVQDASSPSGGLSIADFFKKPHKGEASRPSTKKARKSSSSAPTSDQLLIRRVPSGRELDELRIPEELLTPEDVENNGSTIISKREKYRISRRRYFERQKINFKSLDLHSTESEAPSLSLEDAMKGKSFDMGVSQDNPGPIHQRMKVKVDTLEAAHVDMTALAVPQPPVPTLNHGLDRVLFNRGVYQLQDPHSMVYNFDPYLQKIMPVAEFDYNALAEYKTSSQDNILSKLAKENNIKYVGSTSSMTSTLAHFHYLLSNWRPVSTDMLSKQFPENSTTFTEINRCPNAIFLRWKNGTYAIDADKEYDGANVLMLLGKSLEKLLTMPPSDFEKYRKSDPRTIPESERNAPESYHYSTQGDFLMRSQLDAHDPRLPGTGMFDLKTRAVLSVRMQSHDYEEMSGYELHQQQGRYESFEREYYDMIRSTMLKYSLQVRMGRMDGIFVAYHNVKRIFGFQYLSLNEMDRALHGQSDRTLGNQEFNLSIDLLNKILNKATEKFPEQSLRLHFETRPSQSLPFMYIFAEPMADKDIDEIQNSQKARIAEYERFIMGMGDEAESQSPTSADEGGVTEPNLPLETAEVHSGTLKVTESGVTETAEAHQPPVSEEQTTNAETPTEQTSSTPDDARVAHDQDTGSSDDTADKPVFDSNETEPKETFSPLLASNEAEPEETFSPLLAMTLSVRSKVNNTYVDRPEDLSSGDAWKLDYTLTEIQPDKRAHSMYAATKARRRKLFDKIASKQDGSDDAEKPPRKDHYIDMLRELSQKGRELRAEIDATHSEREKIVVGEPYDRATLKKDADAATPPDEGKAAKSYLGWLFGGAAAKGQ